MSLVIVLAHLHVEVRKPAQFTINITLLRDSGPLRHAGALDFIVFTRVNRSLRLKQNGLLRLEVLVEELLVMSVVLGVEVRGAVVVSLVPLMLARGQLTVIGVLLDDHAYRRLGLPIILVEAPIGVEDSCEALAAKWRLAINRGHRRPQLRIDNNVSGV